MSPSSSSSASVSALIFSGGEAGNDSLDEIQTGEGQYVPSNLNHQPQSESGDKSENKTSAYVEVFQGVSCLVIACSSMLNRAYTEMLYTLIETESHLFNLEELDYITRFVALSRGYTSHLLLLSET